MKNPSSLAVTSKPEAVFTPGVEAVKLLSDEDRQEMRICPAVPAIWLVLTYSEPLSSKANQFSRHS